MDTAQLTFWAPVAIVAAVGVTIAVRSIRSATRQRAASNWESTFGTILMATMQVQRTGNSRREVPLITYAYQVGRQTFQGSRIRVGDELGSITVAGHARNVLARYPVGASVVVFYDPVNPTSSALER